MNKIGAGLVFGLGYVLGAQAGRARYEQMRRQAMRVMDHPRTKQISEQARDTVTRTVHTRMPDTLAARLPEPVARRLKGSQESTAGVAGFDSPSSRIGESGDVRIDLTEPEVPRAADSPGQV